jgi:hypothetical protein
MRMLLLLLLLLLTPVVKIREENPQMLKQLP